MFFLLFIFVSLSTIYLKYFVVIHYSVGFFGICIVFFIFLVFF
jgi:hypothetical protein